MNYLQKKYSIVALLVICLMLPIVAHAYISEDFGVSFGGEQFAPAMNDKIVQSLQDAGVRWMTVVLYWASVELRNGSYDFAYYDALIESAHRRNINVLIKVIKAPNWATNNGQTVPDITAFARFMNVLVPRYSRVVTHWQIWGEPDIVKFWVGSPSDYVTLLRTGNAIIKQSCPQCLVVSAGLNGNGEMYLKKLIAESFQDYCDIIAFHPYARRLEPTPDNSISRVRYFREILSAHNIEKPLWITEIGWQTGGWRDGPAIANDEERKADYLGKALPALLKHAQKVFWYKAAERPGMYGLLELKDNTLRATPSYNKLKRLLQEQ